MLLRLILALLLCAPAIARAQGTLSADAEARWVPFTLTTANHLRFAMTVDGVAAQALLDTGLNHSAVSRDFARRAKLTIDPQGAAAGVALGGSIRVDWAATKSVAFGALDRSGGRVAVIDLPKLLASASGDADVLVGTDLISPHALDIDFANRRFRLLPSGRMPFTGTRVPLSVQSGSGLYLTQAMLAKTRLRPLLIDTGDGGALSIARSAWRTAAIRGAQVTSTIAYGAGGVVDAGLTVTDAVSLGGQPTGPIEVRIEADGGFAKQVRVVGRVGTGLLLRYRVLLDPGAGQMLLSPNPDAPPAPLKSTSGLLLGYDRARLRVLHVMAGGPAAKAGWKADDLICQVDGQAVALTANGGVDVRWGTDAPGRVVRLTMCDGAARTLTLARFY
ncbi:aspartyl protease family protein [Sphingomonas sp. Leaf22]|uniref:aspartyl protease family protein n=1 Tax=Sphingomonas sp. Leaf22 TaxID=1735687 RepID=UPI000B1D470B|nr:aspartyl protease family protein [Sphingomonas sp. Leaf22]